MDFEKFRQWINKSDPFSVLNGIQLTEIKEGYAKAEMPITKNSHNSGGTVNGGALFTLADFTAGYAVDAYGIECVTLDSSVNFLRSACDGKATAIAKEIRRGRHVSVMEAAIYDDDGRQLFHSTFTFFMKGTPIPFLKEGAR